MCYTRQTLQKEEKMARDDIVDRVRSGELEGRRDTGRIKHTVRLRSRTFEETVEHFLSVARPIRWPQEEPDED